MSEEKTIFSAAVLSRVSVLRVTQRGSMRNASAIKAESRRAIPARCRRVSFGDFVTKARASSKLEGMIRIFSHASMISRPPRSQRPIVAQPNLGADGDGGGVERTAVTCNGFDAQEWPLVF